MAITTPGSSVILVVSTKLNIRSESSKTSCEQPQSHPSAIEAESSPGLTCTACLTDLVPYYDGCDITCDSMVRYDGI